MIGRVRLGSSLAVLAAAAAALAACGPSAQANAGNTRADSAHVAAQVAEPRLGDPTAAQAAPPSPAATGTAPVARGTTSAPAPSNTAEASGTGSSAEPPQGKASPEGPKRISARHVLIQWMGSDRAGKSILRTREQALVVAQEVLRRAKAGEDLGRLAVEYSDEPNAGPRGGSLGRFSKGQMVGPFEQVAFKLEVGQISDIVETPFGYHIIQRTE
jgi:hypothetical protein